MNFEWTKLYVQTQLESVVKLLGAEVGDREKRAREAMQAHVEREVGSLRGTVDAMRKTIDSQNERIKSMEAMFGQPGKEADDRTTRRLS